jgi:hypothetical protein
MLEQLLDLSGLSEFLRVTNSLEAAERRLTARP